MTPYELLGGTDGIGNRSNPFEYILVTKDSEYGRALMQFPELEKGMQSQIFRCLQALSEIQHYCDSVTLKNKVFNKKCGY